MKQYNVVLNVAHVGVRDGTRELECEVYCLFWSRFFCVFVHGRKVSLDMCLCKSVCVFLGFVHTHLSVGLDMSTERWM